QQLIIAAYFFKFHLIATNLFKVLGGTMDFQPFNFPEIHIRIGTFGFGHEVDMAYFILIKYYGPVGAVVGYWSGDVETLGELGINDYFGTVFKCFGKVGFYL